MKLLSDVNIPATGTLSIGAITQGSVLFVGASGLVSQDNSNLNFDDANNSLNVLKVASGGARIDAAAKVHLASNFF